MSAPTGTGFFKRFAIPIVIVGVVAAVFLGWQWLTDRSPAATEWYYDLNDQRLFTGPPGLIPPLPAPSGDLANASPGTFAGVKTEVACIPGQSEPTVLLLRTLTPEAKQALITLTTPDPGRSKEENSRLRSTVDSGSLLRLPGDEAWVVEKSPAGRIVMSKFLQARMGGNPNQADRSQTKTKRP